MAFILIPLIMKIPESPKYLYANGRFDEARDVMKTISAKNGDIVSVSAIQMMKFDTEVENSVCDNECNGWQKV